MIDKKTLVLAIAISWVLTLVTVLLISNFAPILSQPFSEQIVESNSVKVVTLTKSEVLNLTDSRVPANFPTDFLDLNFTYTPMNPSKNAILGIVCSFEYSCENPDSATWEREPPHASHLVTWELDAQLFVEEYQCSVSILVRKVANSEVEWNQKWSSEWEVTTFQAIQNTEKDYWINPNQSQYQLRLRLSHSRLTTYVRNVNLMLLVIDG